MMETEKTGGYKRGYATAYKNGVRAKKDGKSRNSCPYPDSRKDKHKELTFSVEWLKAWLDGWDSEPQTEQKETK